MRKALAAIDPAGSAITRAYEGWQAETLPVVAVKNGPLQHLVENEIGGFIRLSMARYEREARQEFSDQVLLELAMVPVSLVEPALAEARRKISYPEKLIPFIFDFIEQRWEKLQTEGDRLAKLVELIA